MSEDIFDPDSELAHAAPFTGAIALIPGSASDITSTIEGLHTLGAAFSAGGDGMAKIDTESHWQGQAADAFRSFFHGQPPKWTTLGDGLTTAAQALQPYVPVLQGAQVDAQRAITLYQHAQQTTQLAQVAYQAKVDAYNQQVAGFLSGTSPRPGPQPAGFVDPGAAGRAQAVQLLTDARRRVSQAADAALAGLQRGVTILPEQPGVLSRIADTAEDDATFLATQYGDMVSGALDTVENLYELTRAVNPFDPYNLFHPQEFVANLKTLGSGLWTMVQNPKQLGETMIQWNTWSSDPGRAIGSLVPGIVAGAMTGGAGAAAEATADGLSGGAIGVARIAAAAGSKIAQRLAGGAADAAADSVAGAAADAAGSDLASAAGSAAARMGSEAAVDAAGATHVPADDLPPWHNLDDASAVATTTSGTADGGVGNDVAHQLADSGATPTAGQASHDLTEVHAPDTGMAAADHAASAQISDAGAGLSTVEADLAKIHVNPDTPGLDATSPATDTTLEPHSAMPDPPGGVPSLPDGTGAPHSPTDTRPGDIDPAADAGPTGSPISGHTPSPTSVTGVHGMPDGLDKLQHDLNTLQAPDPAAATPAPGDGIATGHQPGDALVPKKPPMAAGPLAHNPQVQADLAHTAVRQPDLSALDQTSGPVRWRQDNNMLYRAGNRGPRVFTSGFTPRNVHNLNLPDYILDNTKSGFISTSTDPRYWRTYGRGANYFYEIDAPGGIDANASIPDNIWDTEYEVSMPGGIRPERITGLWPILHDDHGGVSLGEYVPNPNYRPLK